MSKLPLPNPLSDNMEVVFLAVRPPVPHPLDLNLSPWRLGFWLGDDSSGCPSVGGGAPSVGAPLLLVACPSAVGKHTPAHLQQQLRNRSAGAATGEMK
jgi:hypothetical protein